MREISQNCETRLKLDLHVHCFEAIGYCKANLEVVKKIITQMRDRGLDGIAITDHFNQKFAYEVKDIVDDFIGDDVLIIPGREIEEHDVEIIELCLPDKTIFKFIAHPGYPGDCTAVMNKAPDVHGIEIKNGGHSWHMNEKKIREIAEKFQLLLLSNSDAHYLEDIGRLYNEISLVDLSSRVNGYIIKR